MPNRTILRVAIAAAAFVGLATAAEAADPSVLGTHRDWNAFSFDESGNKVCYISSQPKQTAPAGVRRGEIHVLVTHRPADKTFDVVSFIVGYPLRKDAGASVEIDNKRFDLFSDGETAWARDAETDRAIVQAMRSGSKMVMRGTSTRGTNTTDTYSLAGVSAAHDAIGAACGVKR